MLNIQEVNNNSLNIPVFHLLCLTVIVFLAFFMLILEWNSRRIYSWMDHTIGSDTALLAAMRRGEFFTTEEGRYLMSVRRQFGNEVFFDMCCYVRLTLETQIAAKSRLLLNSAGLQAPEEDKLRFREASQEIQALRQSIGKTGVYVLKPVLGPPSACDTALRTLLS